MTSYSGKIIRKTPVTPTQTSASGVWTTADAAAAVKNNLWPVPGVPDPISRSVRLRSSASAYFNRTFGGAPTLGTKQTISIWTKRGALGSALTLLAAGYDGSSAAAFYIGFANDNLQVQFGGSASNALTTSAVYRDPSAWYHIVLYIDTTQATSSNRVLLFVNGVQITAFSSATYPSQNAVCQFGLANANNKIGVVYTGTNYWYDGYLTEINFIDGQALTPSSFGTTNAFTGAWIPMPYTGTYGANGFYLNFKDNTSTTTIGYDYSGNANNWVANNISLTSGVTYDSMLDVPTSWIGYSATTDKSAVTRGNYAVLNPLWKGSGAVIANGNLSNTPTTTVSAALTTIPVSSGKWYAEISHTASNTGAVGMFFTADNLSAPSFSIGTTVQTGLWEWYDNGAGVFVTSDGAAFGSSIRASAFRTAGTFQFALDCDSGKFWFGKDGVWYNSTGGTTGDPAAGTNPTFTITATRGPFNFGVGQNTGYVAMYLNSGQRPFSYTPPTGFTTLCTTNLPAATILNGAGYMAASTYTGTGSALSIVNSGNNTTSTTFQPDFVWVKGRSGATDHALYDSVRGTTKQLESNTTAAETTEATGLTAFDTGGFTVGALAQMNTNTATYVGWQWKAGGAAVSNTNGTITSQVSANTTAGFSIATYTGSGSSATVGHGLGVAPKMYIVKNLTGTADEWVIYHASLPSAAYYLTFTTNGQVSNNVVFNSTAPTSTVFSVGTSRSVSGVNYVAYCFAEVAGYSKFGSYTGNGSADGPFVYCGFRPRYILVKNASAGSTNWIVVDTSTAPYNATAEYSVPNSSAAAATGTLLFDILSNGFKCRLVSTGVNGSGNTMIYAAFAENPFNYSNAR